MYNPHEIVWNDETISNLWDYYSKVEFFNSAYFTRVYGLHIVKYLCRKVDLNNRRLLDYGSGPGYLFESLLKLGVQAKYCALDFSKDSIQALKNRYAGETMFEDAYYVNKFPTGISKKFDIILCCEVIEHLDDEKLGLMVSEVKSLLSSDGYVCLTTPNDENLNELRHICPECGCIYHKWQHMRSWNKVSLEHFMKENGFETLSIEETYCAKLTTKIKFIIKNMISVQKKPNLVYIGKLKTKE